MLFKNHTYTFMLLLLIILIHYCSTSVWCKNDIVTDSYSIIVNDHIGYVSVRDVALFFQANVQYDSKSQDITLSLNNNICKFKSLDHMIYVNGKCDYLEIPPIIFRNQCYFPAVYLMNFLGGQWKWEKSPDISSIILIANRLNSKKYSIFQQIQYVKYDIENNSKPDDIYSIENYGLGDGIIAPQPYVFIIRNSKVIWQYKCYGTRISSLSFCNLTGQNHESILFVINPNFYERQIPVI